MTTALHKAGNQMDVWKQRETLRFMVALVRCALVRYRGGEPEFASDCVPEDEQCADTHITGWAFKKLQDAHVIEPAYAVQNGVRIIVDGQPLIKRRKSERAGRNGAWVNLWTFISTGAAVEFLARNQPLARAIAENPIVTGGKFGQLDLLAAEPQPVESPS